MNEDLIRAGKLAQWLIEEKGILRKTAYIIGAKKFKIEYWQDVCKYYNQHLKADQIKMF